MNVDRDRWAPVVYGRTRKADSWWRTVPAGSDHNGWLGAAVRLVVFGGHGLAAGPRLLVARTAHEMLVAVACRARELSTDMHSDGERPLFCLVGWSRHVGSRDRPVLPTHAELAARYIDWAGPVYQEWMERDWDAHPSTLREPRSSQPGSVPWEEPAASGRIRDIPAGASRLRSLPPGTIALYPALEQAQVWDSAAATTSPYMVTTGWVRARDGAREGVTHVCADDVSTARLLDLRPAPQPLRSELPDTARGMEARKAASERVPDSRQWAERDDPKLDQSRAADCLILRLFYRLIGRSSAPTRPVDLDHPPLPPPESGTVPKPPTIKRRELTDELDGAFDEFDR